jgi:hypothetical protein
MIKIALSGFYILFIYVIFLLAGCKNNITADQQVALYDTEEFKTFLDSFSQDSVFQMSHIAFPLEGMPAPKDSADVINPDFRWTADSWVLHKPYDDYNGTFSRELIDLAGGIVIERVSDASGLYSMERRFAKLSDGWNLIYYREMGKY